MSVRTLSRQTLSTSVFNKRAIVFSGSVAFDGVGDYLVVNDNAALEIGGGSFTIEMFVKTTSSTLYVTLFGRDVNNNSTGDFVVMMNLGSANGGVGIYSTNLSLGGFQTSGVSIRDGLWHHVAVVRNGTAVNIYIDGVSRASTTTSGTLSDSSGDWWIGADEFFSGSRDFAGNISNLRVVKSAVYTSGFTPPTSPLDAIANTGVLTCNNAGSITDISGNGLTVMANGNAASSSLNPFA